MIIYPDGTTSSNIVTADNQVIGTELVMPDDEILNEAMEAETLIDEAADEDCIEFPIFPMIIKMYQRVGSITRFYPIYGKLIGIDKNINAITYFVLREIQSKQVKPK